MAKTKKIDWLNHVLEFAVVIIGILIAFQLNTCRESKKEAKLVDNHIASIIDESKFNRSQINFSIESASKTIQKLDSLMNLLTIQSNNLPVIDKLSKDLLNLDYCYIKRNAYNSLIQSSDVRFVEDFKLKENIISLYEYYRWLESVDKTNQDFYLKYYQPFVMQNLDLLEFEKPVNEAVYNNKEFKNALSSYVYISRYRKQRLEATKSQINNFIEKYDTEE